jgi:hypothetical protein
MNVWNRNLDSKDKVLANAAVSWRFILITQTVTFG